MWENISGIVVDHPVLALVITIFGISTIWLYKEFKQWNEQLIETKASKLNDKIKLYGKLQANIVALVYQSDNIQLRLGLIEKFGEYIVFVSEDARQIWLDYIRMDDPSYLVSLLDCINTELKELEKEKDKLSTNRYFIDVEDFILKLYGPLQPILIIWITLWGGVSLLVTYNAQHTWYDRFNVVTFAFSVFVSFVVTYLLFSLLFQEQLNKLGKYRDFYRGTYRDFYRSFYRSFLHMCLIAAPLLSFSYRKLAVLSLLIQVIAFLLLVSHQKSAPEVLDE